jgi:hypothetical protein
MMQKPTPPLRLVHPEPHLPPALEALKKAADAEEAFGLLQGWSQSRAALSAPADEVEKELLQGGYEVLRRLLDENFKARGVGDVGRAVLRQGADSEMRLGYRRVHPCEYESVFGTVPIDRLGYGAPGESSIHPLDEELNLPRRRYSYVLQERAARLAARGPFDEVADEVSKTTAARFPKRQLEEVAVEAAADFDTFYETRTSALPPPDKTGVITVAGVDCKGVPRHRSAEEREETQPVRLGSGEKRTKKKMATVASVHTTDPYVRSPEEVTAQLMDPNPPRPQQERPKVEHRRIWASLLKSKDEVIAEVAEEMKRRDPNSRKIAVCVTDGEEALKRRTEAQLDKAFGGVFLILDIIHALEYLWKAAYAFHSTGSEEARLWVRERLLQTLRGNVSRVVAGMRQSATKQGLSAAKRRPVDKACDYFLKNKDRMDYGYYLAMGLPIASGMVEGACGHLVRDRMELTGALWNVEDQRAEAVLKLRALDKSGDMEDYWDFHLNQEHNRLYQQTWKAA